jgi:hypothetical protein
MHCNFFTCKPRTGIQQWRLSAKQLFGKQSYSGQKD